LAKEEKKGYRKQELSANNRVLTIKTATEDGEMRIVRGSLQSKREREKSRDCQGELGLARRGVPLVEAGEPTLSGILLNRRVKSAKHLPKCVGGEGKKKNISTRE